MNDTGQSNARAARAETRYLLVVFGMLLLIIALLGGLWLRMRFRALGAEARAAVLDERLTRQRGALADILRGMGPVRPPGRDEQVTLDGRKVVALRLTPAVGEGLGFRPGEVIIVDRRRPSTGTAPGATVPGGGGPHSRPRVQ